MRLPQKLPVAFLLLCVLGSNANAAETARPPTKRDIPPDLPAQTRKLIERTFSSSRRERRRAANDLGIMGKRATPAIPFLIRMLGDDRESFPPSVSDEAYCALLKIGEPAVQPLIGALDDPNHPGKWCIVRVLGSIRDPRAVQPVICVLGDKKPNVRSFAAEALGKIGDRAAIEPLLGRLQDVHEDLWVRKKAAGALGKILDPRAVEPLIAILRDRDGDPRLRELAAAGLGGFQSRLAVGPLLSVLKDADENDGVRSAAAFSLGQIGDPRAVKPLLAVLADVKDDSYVRDAAARGLGCSKDPSIVEPLLVGLRDEESRVRDGAGMVLAWMGERRVIKPLLGVLRDDAEGWWERHAAARALLLTKDPCAVASVVAVFEDPDTDFTVQRTLLDEMAWSHDPRLFMHAIRALQDEAALIRREAARVFAQTGHWHAVGMLGIDPEGAARKLPALDDPRVVEPLIAILKNKSEDPVTRRYAAIALGKTGHPRALELLYAFGEPEDAAESDAEGSSEVVEPSPIPIDEDSE